MIQELFFTPHSQSRSSNQVNTSVTLRYNTRTEELQLVDIFGNVKKLNIDTTPDLEIEDLSTIITVDYIKNLGFNTADEIAAEIPKYEAGWGIGIDKNEEGKDIFFVPKDTMSSFFIDCLSGSEDTQQNIKDIINKDYISGLGFRLAAEDKDTIYSGQSGITVEEIDGVNKIFLEPGFLSATLTGLGFVPHDFDTYYFADEDILTIEDVATEVESGTLIRPTFKINKDNLSTFVGTYLEENQFISEKDNPVIVQAGEGLSMTEDEENNTNIIALTAHLPVVNEGEGIQVTEVDGDYTVALTAHIPSSINDVWTDEANSGYIRSLGFALSSELSDTLYYAGSGITLTQDTNNNDYHFNVDQQWLDTFITSYGYITGYVDTTYEGSDSIDISTGNVISIKESWIIANVPSLVVTTIGTAAGQIAVKNVITSGYIKDLGFVPTGEQQDTTYDAGNGLELTSTTFSVDTLWLGDQISAFADENITSTWLSGTGIAISDTTCVSGMGILIEEIANEAEVWKTQKISVDLTWLSGFLNRYNFDHDIVGRHGIAAGDGIGITVNDETKTDTISLTASIPSSLAAWNSEDAMSANTNYISSLGFVLAGDDKDTKYGVISNGGLTVNTDHNFAIDTNWMDNRVSSFITSSALPTKVSELNNDMSFVTAADLEAVRLSLMQQFANLTVVVDIDGDVDTPNQNIYIETDEPVTSNTTFTGKNITVTKLANSNSYVAFNSTGDISISKLTNSGNLTQNMDNGNAQIPINTSGRVVITDSILNQTGYNAIEIGLDPSIEPPKSVLIDNVKFDGALTNNAITIFGTADEAIVTISKCDFTQVKNALRISNRTNCKVTVNLINCTFGTFTDGIIICQDYTSSTAGEVSGLNLFGPSKVTINMIGCSHNGNPITFSDPSTVCGTGDANQLLYVYSQIAGGLIAYDAAKYPNFSAK